MINADPYPELDEPQIDALYAASRQAVAGAYEALGGLAAGKPAGELALFRFLPRKYLPRYDLAFAQRFATTVTTVAWKLAEPGHVYGLACTAEDLALKYILDLAAQQAGGADQFEDFAAELFDDQSFLILWDQSQDGSEDRCAGTANLAFGEWFEPFGDREQVHPFLQPDPRAFRRLWSEAAEESEDIEDPVTEVFIAMGEDWLDVPDQITDQIPAIIAENRGVLFPEAPARSLTAAQREQVFESAAADVRLILHAARSETGTAYDVWLLKDDGPGKPKARRQLHSGLPLEEALSLRKVERMGEYRGVTDVELRVYPADHSS